MPEAPTLIPSVTPETHVPEPTTGGTRRAHIVAALNDAEAGHNAAANLITEAIVFSFEVEALCGYRWVPSRQPEKYPVCANCKGIAANL